MKPVASTFQPISTNMQRASTRQSVRSYAALMIRRRLARHFATMRSMPWYDGWTKPNRHQPGWPGGGVAEPAADLRRDNKNVMNASASVILLLQTDASKV
jgi:hypothetical protein